MLLRQSMPRMRARPELGRRKPSRVRMSVDLPAPFGPSRPIAFPVPETPRRQVIPWRISRRPSVTFRLSSSTTADMFNRGASPLIPTHSLRSCAALLVVCTCWMGPPLAGGRERGAPTGAEDVTKAVSNPVRRGSCRRTAPRGARRNKFEMGSDSCSSESDPISPAHFRSAPRGAPRPASPAYRVETALVPSEHPVGLFADRTRHRRCSFDGDVPLITGGSGYRLTSRP